MSDDYWPKGELRRTPAPPPKPIPMCRRCSQRHDGPTPICKGFLPVINEDEDDER